MHEYSTQAKVLAHESFRQLLDSGVSPGGARIVILSAQYATLAIFQLETPCGVVSESGALTLAPHSAVVSVLLGGLAAYAHVQDSDGVTHLTMPCTEGADPMPGAAVLDSQELLTGADVQLVAAVIGGY